MLVFVDKWPTYTHTHTHSTSNWWRSVTVASGPVSLLEQWSVSCSHTLLLSHLLQLFILIFFICVFIYNDFNFRDGWMLSLQCLKPLSEACCCWLAFTLVSLCRAFSSSACFSSSHYSSVPETSTSVFFSTGISVKFHKNWKVILFLLSPLTTVFIDNFNACLM